MKIRVAAPLAALAVLVAAVPAAAHVTVSPESAPADEYATLQFSVPHGCQGSPTTRLRIRVPETVPSVTPERVPQWRLSSREGPKRRTELHGETITRGVSEVTWTAEQPLPEGQLALFALSARLPAEAGETVYFPAIQECERGEHRWIQIPAAGEDPHALEEPAPALNLTAAAAEGGAAAGGEEAEGELAAAEVGGSGEDDGGAPTWLAIVALALGALGLLAGTAALLAARRSAA